MKRYLCIGDSLTYGYDVAVPYRWTTIVAQKAAIHIDNEGQCGDTAQGVACRLDHLDLSRYDGFFVMAGSKDILLDIPLKETKVAMETIGAMLAPWNKTVYIGIPPVTKEESALFGWQRVSDVARHNEELRLYGTWLVTWSCQKGFRIIDFLKALDIGTGNVYEDGVHPNEQGYALFAQAFLEAFETEMRTK